MSSGSAHPLAPTALRVTPEAALESFLAYAEARGLALYDAQEEALLALWEGHNVILQTPTGSGKSLVAAGLHHLALTRGERSVYTCPIKALVNEKFLALCRDFGPEAVGLSTGDASVNLGAPILCCTAEVLSNLALRDGPGCAYTEVVLDEFHYYGDSDRGVAWQIPLLTLDRARFLLLSATLGDTAFFERALTARNGRPSVSIRSTHRPVPLEFEYREDSLEDLLPELESRGRLPAYLVHFTQRAATETAQNLMSLDLCSRADKAALAEALTGERFQTPFGADLRRYLRHGLGVHHAGLLPRYRVLVERLARENRLKVICGTDTLGVGVNVPIRTVVFTGLTKYDGARVRHLTARDFHQISGRAGRKGFDDRGFVVVLAPEHVIENRKLERKARESPEKARKLVRRKPPEGQVQWDENTYRRLLEASPEPLQSSFQVSHGMILNVLSRPTDGCRELRRLIADCHDGEPVRRAHRRRAWQLFRALLEKGILEWLPAPEPTGRKLRVHADLQEDFSLHHALSLFLVDAVTGLDPADPAYPLLVLSLVEAVLEDPAHLLQRQVERAREALFRELKEQGVPFEERQERLREVEHPKPDGDRIYALFNAFADRHPWVGRENIRPKSIAREMFERYQSFADHVREYGLERSEGLLLRHLAGVYKTLTQTVPEGFRTEALCEQIVYLEQIVRGTDSSLLEEWERLRDPSAARPDDSQSSAAAPARGPDPLASPEALERLLRHGVFRVLQPLAGRRWRAAAEALAEMAGRPPGDAAPPPLGGPPGPDWNEGRGVFPWHADALERAFAPYFEEHGLLRLDPPARARALTRFDKDSRDGSWRLEQILCDPGEANDWILLCRADLAATRAAGEPRLELLAVEKIV